MTQRLFNLVGQALCLVLAFFSSRVRGAGGGEPEALQPPAAKVVPKRLERHGHVRLDNYYWMRERDNVEVVRHLKAENDYAERAMAHTRDLQETLFREFKARIKQTDLSVPYQKDGWSYYTRVQADKQYPLYCRKKEIPQGPQEVYLDVNQVAEGLKYCSVSAPAISPNGQLMAYGVDTAGRRFYSLRFRNLSAGENYQEVIPNVTGNVAWANDNRTLFYSRQDPVTLRSCQIWRHRMGTDPAADILVYEEKDPTFRCWVYASKSKRFLIIASRQTMSKEVRILSADLPMGQFKVFHPRQRGHEYEIGDSGDYFYIRTNHKAKNFRLMRTPLGQTDLSHWQEVIPHRPGVLLESIELFKDYLVTTERREGLRRLCIRPWSGAGAHEIEFEESAYVAAPGPNHSYDSAVFRYTYSSMTTPPSVYDYDMGARAKTLLKREEVLAGFDPENYQTERLHATAPDGRQVPISLVYHKKHFTGNGSNPLLLYGYGSYGSSLDADFNAMRVSLLDRGFVFALAHVRGGSELGREWYEGGRLLQKTNTFSDFIACAEHLVKTKHADPQRLFAQGGSAGGLLMGAVINLRPDLFKGIIADVPWVDVVTGMLDESIPLTTEEYDEWGNPNDRAYYDYMLAYSPYDQVSRQAYPHILAMTSFQDSQVQYWDPAKWVAKLRVLKTDANRVLLKTEMEASHGGLSARDDRYRQWAFRYAFLLDLAFGAQIAEKAPNR